MIDPAKVASDINAFLKSMDLPIPVTIAEEDVRIVGDSAVVSKTIHDVQVSVTIPPSVLNHMSMAMGVLSAFASRK